MKKLLFCLLLLTAPPQLYAQAPARAWNQAELDALLAPIALYPDALLRQILDASIRPGQVAQAARWARANPGLSGDEAVNQARDWAWHPSVTALVAFPDVLIRMDENPQWLRDLSEAYRESEPYVMETIQQLRRRAEAAGNLPSDEHQQVVRQGDTIVIQPVYSQVVYAPYYNPLVVFGSWWWTSYRPVVWRPWVARPVRWHWAPRLPVHAVRPVAPRPVHAYGTPGPAVHVQLARAQPIARPQVHAVARPEARAVVHGGSRPVLHAAQIRALTPVSVQNRGQGPVFRARASSAPSRGR